VGPYIHSAVQYVWPNEIGPASEYMSNTQLKHACEIKYFGSVKVQTAREFNLCRLTVGQITISAVGLWHWEENIGFHYLITDCWWELLVNRRKETGGWKQFRDECMYVCVWVCVCIGIRMYICVYVCIDICIYIRSLCVYVACVCIVYVSLYICT